jgi:hypothetical protein
MTTTTAAGTILTIDLGKGKCVACVRRECNARRRERGPGEGTSLYSPRPEGGSVAQLVALEVGTSV